MKVQVAKLQHHPLSKEIYSLFDVDDLTKSILEEADNQPANTSYDSGRAYVETGGDSDSSITGFGLVVAICAAALLFGGEPFNWWTVTWEFENVDTEEDGFAFEGKVVLEHGMDEGHVVHAGGELGEQVAHPDSRLSAPAELPETGLTVTRLGGEKLELAAWIEGRALPPLELRLVVVGVDMAQAPRAKDLDDPLGLGRMVHRQLVRRSFLGP